MDWKAKGNSTIEMGAVWSFAAYSPGKEGKEGMSRHEGSIYVTCYCMSTKQLFTSELISWIPVESMQRNTRHIWNVCLQMRSPPLDMLIIPADAETPRMPKCRHLNLLRDIWPREIAFGWEKFDTTLKMLLPVPYLFFMEKEDVYPVLFFITRSPSVPVMWDQPSDGCLKTSITTLKFLSHVPWAQIHRHAARSTWACCTLVSHPSQNGRALLRTSISIFSQKKLKLSCGHLYMLHVMKVCDSQYHSVMMMWVILLLLVCCDNPECHHNI